MSLNCVSYLKLPFAKIHYNPVGDINPVTINKPTGGLWSSPYNTEMGWYDVYPFIEDTVLYPFEFSVSYEGKYMVDRDEHVRHLISNFGETTRFAWPSIDFELLAKYYDSIHVTMRGIAASMRYSPFYFSGWDCETVFVMQKSAILPWNNE